MSVPFDTIPAGAVASGVFIEQKFRKSGSAAAAFSNRIALLGQYLAAKTPTNNLPVAVTNADEVAAIAGYGSQAHLMAVKLFEVMGSAPALVDYFPIADGTTAATGTIVFASNATSSGVWTVYICGKPITFAVASGDTPTQQAAALSAAINADLTLPVTSSPTTGTVTCTSKWKGLSANGITLAKNLYGTEQALQPAGTTMTVTTMASGAGDPVLTGATANFGNTFYTYILTGLNDATAAAALEAAFTARIDPVVKKPTVGVMGWTDTRANFLTALASRNNPGSCYIPVEGSPNHPGQIAAAAVGRMAVRGNANPARPHKGHILTGIIPGTATPWTWAQENAVELAGGSVTYVSGGQVVTKDVLTTYKTNTLGAVDDSWRYVVAVTNLQAKYYTLDQMFLSSPFDAAILVDDEATTNLDYALSPKAIKSYVVALVDAWVANVWSKNRDYIVENIIVEIDGTNAGRVNILIPDVQTVGLRIVAIRYQWAFAAA